MALFMGAMDALIMSAAMPTIITDLGGLSVYSWVYSAYFLSRAVSLPIFGKLADLFRVRNLFLLSIGIFLSASVMAGLAPTMNLLIAARVIQGIGAGGNFALVYIALTDVAPPGKRAKTLSLASFVWGISSVLGPTLGGFVVTYFSWRWIFFINVPISLFSMGLIYAFLVEIRGKKEQIHLDIAGVVTLSVAILGLLTIAMMGGREIRWSSSEALVLCLVTGLAAAGFYVAERRAREPILAIEFFAIRGFSVGNLSVFLSSFAIFSLFAYAPLFVQGALGKSPMQVGIAMLSLSLGWSLGSLLLGQVGGRLSRKSAAVAGALFLLAGSGWTLTFSHLTSMHLCFWAFFLVGLGMGFVTLATLLIVQGCMDHTDLGVATSSHQFFRTMGGTVGVGVCGGVATGRLNLALGNLSTPETAALPAFADTLAMLEGRTELLFQNDFLATLDPHLVMIFQQVVGEEIRSVFWVVLAASAVCLLSCLCLPGGNARD